MQFSELKPNTVFYDPFVEIVFVKLDDKTARYEPAFNKRKEWNLKVNPFSPTELVYPQLNRYAPNEH